jgi:hypothetical protein
MYTNGQKVAETDDRIKGQSWKGSPNRQSCRATGRHEAARRGSDGLTVERLVIMPIVQTRAEGLGDFMAGSCFQA